ncbi:hypothetical protein V6N11_009750 [Hibiscus sabdariffa]|uniref:FAD-binding PCMH-type domain-containing protein n=1 Tax=Hibiscus sabdariffa TaxID=183260 RepID=A0ABR2P6R4_9ROSI
MKLPSFSLLPFLLVVLISLIGSTFADSHGNFLDCFRLRSANSSTISKVIYLQNNPSYSSVLNASIQNTRFTTPATPKPIVIVTALQISHIQSTLYCSRKHGLQIRIRSGGHDFEGLSYVSQVPFLILDLLHFRAVDVDVKNEVAWVESGATLGELYYGIASKTKTLAFPAGVCHTVGIGGHFSGGGYGILLRKYGLAADHVIDAQLMDARGRILDRKSMGEDLFWAIRGGGGNTFGIVLAWKIKLVQVPAVVTVYTVNRNLEQNVVKILHRWQYIAHQLPDDLFTDVTITKVNSSGRQAGKKTVQAAFKALYLGGADKLIPLVQERFPELGLTKQDCLEMSWAESVLYFGGVPTQSLEIMLNRTALPRPTFKAKSDYVKQPIPESGLQGIMSRFLEKEADVALMMMVGFGGKMDEIPENELPYPHRAGNLFQASYLVGWTNGEDEGKYISWIRRLYSYMASYASKSPREAYFNYRDLDIGTNNVGYTSFEQASVWGLKYFKNNFKRLVQVKTMVDPTNFFGNEQSVPPLPSPWKKKGN